MADPRTVVVTGYGDWAMTAPNPASLVLRELAALDWRDCRFVPIEVPVKTNPLMATIRDALLAHRPALWLGLGVAPGAVSMRGEMIGINCRDFDVPDNEGLQLAGEPIVADGPDAYFSTLPMRDIVDAIQEAGVPASISYSAGTHLCNQMLYSSLHLVRQLGLATQCGFLHVPYTPDLASRLVESEGLQPSMALVHMIEAARIAVERSLLALEGGLSLDRSAAGAGNGTGESNASVSIAGE